MSSLSDSLWDNFRTGSERAFERIFLMHNDELYTYGMRLCRDEEVVKDALQELFQRLWQRRDKVGPVAVVRPYLFKALRYQLADVLGATQRQRLKLADYTPEFEVQYSPEELLIANQLNAEQQAQLAQALGLLNNRQREALQPKLADGSFAPKFDPSEPWRGFQEGNALQYTFFVPQNPAGLIAAIGTAQFNSRLDSIFTVSEKSGFGGGKEIDAFAGIKSIYNHGNQPNLHISWLFNFSGKPWLTQKWTRRICDEFYGTEPIHGYGYGQDEDQGQLGSWYVITALGLFDVKGFTDARPIVQLSSPIFRRATIALAGQKKLVIEAPVASQANCYIQSARFNGKPLANCWLYRDELMQGGKLEFVMGSQPNTTWGTQVPPPSAQYVFVSTNFLRPCPFFAGACCRAPSACCCSGPASRPPPLPRAGPRNTGAAPKPCTSWCGSTTRCRPTPGCSPKTTPPPAPIRSPTCRAVGCRKRP